MPRLPKDINPESGARLPFPDRNRMSDAEKEIYDRIAGPGARLIAGLKGPFGSRLHDSILAGLQYQLNQYFRFDAGLNTRIRELAILVTAREMDSRFEWASHETVAIKEGLEPEIINIVKYRKSAAGLKGPDAAIIKLGREMFGKRKVSSATYKSALEAFGAKQLVTLVGLMSHYAATAAELCVFNNQVDPKKPKLPVL